ncbi:MAG: SMC-Scp complex subunit ScpB [Peptostreptococcaceae bacterium]|nr:SMC-Scp complex subunit ScpB [Peptostreptococcaceae bacterium]
MEINNLVSIIESLLFVASESMSARDLTKIITERSPEISIKEVRAALDELSGKYDRSDSGLSLLRMEDRYEIVSKEINNPYVEGLIVKRKKKTLTQASLEVISIIAYKQPITKLEIDEIRGVKSDGVVSNLLDLGLIEEKGRLDRIGKPILYGTTEKFLREFGIEKIKDLPKVAMTENEDE